MKEITLHPKYRPKTAYFDLAVVRIDPVSLSEDGLPVCLPAAGKGTSDSNANGMVAGWKSSDAFQEPSTKSPPSEVAVFPKRYAQFRVTR
jgi:hypothetical protein